MKRDSVTHYVQGKEKRHRRGEKNKTGTMTYVLPIMHWECTSVTTERQQGMKQSMMLSTELHTARCHACVARPERVDLYKLLISRLASNLFLHMLLF